MCSTWTTSSHGTRDSIGDARKWGLLGVYEPRLLIAPEGCLEGSWAQCPESQVAMGNWTLEPSLGVPWRNENKGVFLLADSGARLGYGGGVSQAASARRASRKAWRGLILCPAFIVCVAYSEVQGSVWLPLKSCGTFPDNEFHGLNGFAIGGEDLLLDTRNVCGHKFRDLPDQCPQTPNPRLQAAEFSNIDLVGWHY